MEMGRKKSLILDLVVSVTSAVRRKLYAKRHVVAGVVNRVTTGEKIAALTFNADLTPKMETDLKQRRVTSWYDEEVGRVLTEARVPATFFFTGKWARAHSEIVKTLGENPLFEIGNHGYSHGGFSIISASTAGPQNVEEADIKETDKFICNYPACRMFFRFQRDAESEARVGMLRKLGYTVIGGDIFGADVKLKNPHRVAKRVIREIRPGSIIVLHVHDGEYAPATGKALPEIIIEARKMGYQFMTITELLKRGTPAS